MAKGNAAEAVVLAAFVERGLDVLVPFGEGHPYDMLVDLRGNTFLRVQCKTARRHGECLVFNSRATDHVQGRRSYLGVADIFGVYSALTRGIYLVPVAAVSGFEVNLRLVPTRNNQRQGVRLASDYEIGRWTTSALTDVARHKGASPKPRESLRAISGVVGALA